MPNKTLLPLKVPGLLADSQQAMFYPCSLSSWPGSLHRIFSTWWEVNCWKLLLQLLTRGGLKGCSFIERRKSGNSGKGSGLCSRLEAQSSFPSPSSLFQFLWALSVSSLMPRASKDLQNSRGLTLPFSLTPKFWVLHQTCKTHFFLKCPFLIF